ncbi:hypothetical protein GCM10010510_37990 [Streptomyces anandii JCM 4720]|nr:hypothetical protein GCM10010510_37990 [Streptomyces anandii JCM 4720]
MNTALTSEEATGPVLLDAAELLSDRDLSARFARSAHRILADLVRSGAALGWVEPPSEEEVADLLDHVLAAARAGDGALRTAWFDGRPAGLGYWLRYARPTHRPHADLEKLAVDPAFQGRGVGRALTAALVADARRAGIEVLTLDARGDNTPALALYRSLGFTEYGRLPGFVAVGERRHDKVFCKVDLRPTVPPMTERRAILSGSVFEERIGYARAVVDGDWVHVSGTTGFDYAAMTISDDVVEQAEQCLRNIGAALGEAGCGFRDVVRVRYLLPEREDFEPCWPLLRRAFGEVRPAATMMVCGLADPRMRIEIEVYARRPDAGA